MLRRLLALLCAAAVLGAAWLSARGPSRPPSESPASTWVEVAPGVLRSPGLPAGYALLSGDRALLIDAPCAPDGLNARGIKQVEGVLLTHHHRDTASHAARYLALGVPVRASKESAPWLTPEGVRKYWQESLPLRNSRTAYLVLPEGLADVDCSLADGAGIDWRGWSVKVVATPGHSPDHVAFLARRGKEGKALLFCGDALAGPGTVWTPYTTDWDHWTDAGLKPAVASLRKLAKLEPGMLLPAHGEVLTREPVRALEKTAEQLAEVAFLKSFERYTKDRLKDAPRYAFLAKEQAGTNGSRPWSRISLHLWLTGNTYVLVSKDGPCLVVDPWDPHSARQIPKLQGEEKIGKAEVVFCSHAHFDHYDGTYGLLERDRPQVWTLDHVALPVADPTLLRAPFLDPRPLPVQRRVKDGEVVSWREYEFTFCYLPGQTDFTMGVQTTIDGKRCFFTADNFFHHDLYSGTGGWMGLNRSSPLGYAQSARKVLEARPDWVLAEHGSAMEFSAEDFRRRVRWGEEGAKAANAISPSGEHRHDWSPHGVCMEPVILPARAGGSVKAVLCVENPLRRERTLVVRLEGRGIAADREWTVEVPAGARVRRAVTLEVADRVPAGRHVLVLVAKEGERPEPADAFVALEVSR